MRIPRCVINYAFLQLASGNLHNIPGSGLAIARDANYTRIASQPAGRRAGILTRGAAVCGKWAMADAVTLRSITVNAGMIILHAQRVQTPLFGAHAPIYNNNGERYMRTFR
jgi:hypothetical protein